MVAELELLVLIAVEFGLVMPMVVKLRLLAVVEAGSLASCLVPERSGGLHYSLEPLDEAVRQGHNLLDCDHFVLVSRGRTLGNRG
nr:hypothetical protein Iba_chr03dCG3470 [Ipomoea batatas]